MKALEKERDERRKVRRKTKTVVAPAASTSAPTPAPAAGGSADVDMVDAAPAVEGEGATAAATASAEAGGALEPESEYRSRELTELEALVDPALKTDVGASVSGLYELVGIVTHKGAAADAGHYIGFVKKSVFNPPVLGEETDSDEDWYKFDDDKVSVFPKEKLATLDGGGTRFLFECRWELMIGFVQERIRLHMCFCTRQSLWHEPAATLCTVHSIEISWRDCHITRMSRSRMSRSRRLLSPACP